MWVYLLLGIVVGLCAKPILRWLVAMTFFVVMAIDALRPSNRQG